MRLDRISKILVRQKPVIKDRIEPEIPTSTASADRDAVLASLARASDALFRIQLQMKGVRDPYVHRLDSTGRVHVQVPGAVVTVEPDAASSGGVVLINLEPERITPPQTFPIYDPESLGIPYSSSFPVPTLVEEPVKAEEPKCEEPNAESSSELHSHLDCE